MTQSLHQGCSRNVVYKDGFGKKSSIPLKKFSPFFLANTISALPKTTDLKIKFLLVFYGYKVQHFVSHRNVRKKPFPSRQKSSKFYIEFQKIHFSKLRRLHK